MGLETAALVMGAITVAAETGKAVFEVGAANEHEKALGLQAKEFKLQNQQKTLSNYDVLQKTIEAQEAHMAASGTAFSSPSFNAIQRSTLNIAAKKQRNTAIEGELEQENIDIEKANVRKTLFAQLFGDTANLALAGTSIASKIPTLSEA